MKNIKKIHVLKKNILISVFLTLTFPPAVHAELPNSPVPLVAMAAKKIGVKACLAAITKVAEKNSSGATSQNIVVNWNRKSPDSSPFFSMTALGAKSNYAVLSITAFPLPHKGCALMVERTFSSSESCSVIAQKNLSSYLSDQLIEGVMVYQDPVRPEETYTLVQNNNNCTVFFRNSIPKWNEKP